MSPPSKSCAVCGDKALGYNFNAVTCESCKAFFRRNALAKKQFTCPFNSNCEITQITRRFCQKCRLKKCLDIGMKSENIMSEQDKLLKRRIIEKNRAKRRMTEVKRNADSGESAASSSAITVKEEQHAADSSGCDVLSNAYDSQSCGSFDSSHANVQPSSSTSAATLLLGEPLQAVSPELMTGEEMVEFIVCDPDRASQAISRIMRNPKEALCSIEKILNSQKDALKLISHLIAYPGDALKIISKIMNSPFDALTVFTKFMSSPTDALEIISKIVSSPQDVLQFIRNLMDSPEDALDIMNKFMNTPAEALKILNKIFNGTNGQIDANLREQINQFRTGDTTETVAINNEENFEQQEEITQKQPQQQLEKQEHEQQQFNVIENEHTLIHSMLNSSPSSVANEPMLPPPPMTPLTPMTPNSMSTTTTLLSPYTPSPQTMSINSPLSVGTNEIQDYNSPSSLHDELPSTSAGFISPTHTGITTEAADDFANEHFDIKTFIQNSFPENAMNSAGDSLNSLESVLTEVIRIEYEAFSNLPPEPRVKYEQQTSCMQMMLSQQQQQQQGQQHQQHSGYNSRNGCYMTQQTQQPSQQPVCAPSSMLMGRDLNEAEQMKLRELKIASEALYYPVDDDLSVLMMGDDRIKQTEDARQDPKLMQLINLTAVAIKRLIKMAKKITAFRDMCQEDQVALLKGGCTEMMIMRSVMTYDDDRNTWKIPHLKEDMSTIRADVLKRAKGNVYEEHLKFIRTFDEKWRMDENIILIMCAIVLFTPARSRVIHSDVIRLEQNSYYYLLRRYLESVYPGCEAKSAFIKLIQKISDVERLNQFMIGVYLNVNPSQVEPLLREIFDLKNH